MKNFLKANLRAILVVVAILAFGLIAYSFLGGSFSTLSPLKTSTPALGEDNEILSLLLELKGYELKDLDQRTLSDPIFRNLKNFTVEVPYEKPGRANPFAPFGNLPSGVPQINLKATF